MKRSILPVSIILGLFLGISGYAQTGNTAKSADAIKPYSQNPGYWQYKGEPVLLIGGSDDDNLFQMSHLESHLDSMKSAGGNYVRNTMSDRDKGDERAFYKNKDGKYDLSRWNNKYWESFEDLLKLTFDRDIIVQIEIWDRFDHSRNEWISDPYNPKNNINYSYEKAKLSDQYPKHPGNNSHPFFFTVPALDNNEVLLSYQKAFVNKLLSISLPYGNVLYCMDNETSGREEWATFWSDFIKQKTGDREVQLTEMWDSWDVTSEVHKRTIDHPNRYSFIDISQNSQTTGHSNWENAQYVFNYISNHPRPVNSTKIYGSEESWISRGISKEHAIETFFRNLIGGFASSRFHRPAHGQGLSQNSIACIKTIRKIESLVKFWDINPRMDLLRENEKGEAYLAAKEGSSYLVYFPKGGDVKIDLSKQNGRYTIHWIAIDSAVWIGKEKIRAGKTIPLASICEHGCIAVIVNK